MKTRTRVLLTIFLAVLYWLIFSRPATVEPQKLSRNGNELAEQYKADNTNYFDGKLPANVSFSYVLEDPINNMAETTYPSPNQWAIAVAPQWMTIDMTRKLLMLHEECHVYTDSQGSREELNHGPRWRACMLMIEMKGAFRDVLIYAQGG